MKHLNESFLKATVAACLWLLCCAAVPAAAQSPPPPNAPGSPAQSCDYINFSHPEKRTYRVREVRVESKIDFLHAISRYLKEVKGKLPLQSGHDYPLIDIITGKSRGRQLIEDELDKATKNTDPRNRFRIVRGRLENCDQAAGQLDVVYRIFLTNYDDYLSYTWELKSKEVEEPGNAAAEPKAENVKGFLTVKPAVGYNRTRRGFVGGLLRLKMPGGLFETAELSAVASPTSDEEVFELAGSRSPKLTALNHLDYRLSYRHSNEPAGTNRLRVGTLSFQAFGASRPLGERGVILRYGASVEGGNQHTDLDAAAAAGGSAADSGYGGLKAYVGATMRLGGLALAGSYGIQLGTRGATADVDFVKHLGDLALTTQFWKREGKPGKVNRALTVEARLAVGIIQSHGRIPVTQRFFGGNVQKNFIEGDGWRMLRGPFIRSLPENRLNSAGDIGGTRFYSANFTIGREVWGYPLMPKELKEEPGFVDTILPGAVTSTRSFLRNSYLVKVPAYVEFAQKIPSMKMPTGETLHEWLTALDARLTGLIDSPPNTEVEDSADETRGLLRIMNAALEEEGVEPAKMMSNMIDKERDCQPTPDKDCAPATMLRINLVYLAGLLDTAGMGADAAAARDDAAMLLQKQQDIVTGVEGLDLSLAERMADEDTKVVKAALDAFTKELNVVAVSPVAVFDVARVWPDSNGTRYGAGAGVRVSVFNLNTTLGYAFNVNRRPGDGRGALFFSLDFTNIFR
jgi:hypothetical protein